MSPTSRKLTSLAVFFAPLLALMLFLPLPPPALGTALDRPDLSSSVLDAAHQLTDTSYLYMPFIPVNLGPPVELQGLQMFDMEGDLQAAFQLAEGFAYVITAYNQRTFPLTVTLHVSHLGPCGTTQIYSGPLGLPPGVSLHTFPASGETCAGIYIATAEFSYQFISGSLFNFLVVNPASTVVVNQQHGFDACHPPTVAEMQAWWDSSPYYVYNLYLGGSLFACEDEPLDPFWVHQVAGQGWEFILSWVGPQAPCTGFQERISASPAVAYYEGRAEAQLASEAAEQLGLLGDRVIYYDVEGYASASGACRSAVKSFIQGWTDELHDQGFQAGAYGGACSSYLADWAANNPAPDDVWIAHWGYSRYNPAATVWDAPCVSNNLWDDHQRIKQYAGGHDETWGNVTLNIDSDVLDGEVTAIPFGARGRSGGAPAVTLTSYGIPWQDVRLVSPSQGWARTDTRLWAIGDGGSGWEEITPDFDRLLEVDSLDGDQLWAIGFRGGALSLAASDTGGRHWMYQSLSAIEPGPSPVTGASLEVQPSGEIHLVLRRASGSSFNLGQVFSSTDRGATWRLELNTLQEAANPSRPARAAALAEEEPSFALPEGTVAASFAGERDAWVIVQRGECAGEKAGPAGLTCVRSWQLLATGDAGITWVELSPG